MGMGGRHRGRSALLALLVVAGGLAFAPRSDGATVPPPPGRLESFELASPLVDTASPGGRLSGKRTVPKVNVLLPPGYDEHPDARYPVLWLLHGANGGTDTWVRGLAKFVADQPAIIVMPDGGVFGMYVDWWNAGERGGPAWATYHLQVLRELVEQRYRIRPERRWHAIGGISMGGQGALRYAALLPGYFGSVATFSAALPDMQTLEGQVGLTALVAAGGGTGVDYSAVYGSMLGPYAEGNNAWALVPNYEHTRMFLSSGNGVPCPGDPSTDTFAVDVVTETFIGLQQPRFAARARSAGAEVTDQQTCGVHTFGPWDRAFVEARRWGFFAPVPEHPGSWTHRTIATAGEVWGLRYRFAAPPATVVELRRRGDQLSITGTGRITLTGPAGCALDLRLPYAGPLPAACRTSPSA